jgi:hypothetical protein
MKSFFYILGYPYIDVIFDFTLNGINVHSEKYKKPHISVRLLYQERESNPHGRYGHKILSLACLPIPPSRLALPFRRDFSHQIYYVLK